MCSCNKEINEAEMHNTLMLIAKELEQFHTIAITKSEEWKAKVNGFIGSPKTNSKDENSDKCLQTEEEEEIICANEKLKVQNEALSKIINISFEKLKTIRGESINKLDTLEQLKELVVCCGQYYADYSNEHNKATQLEHKNNFLCSKTVLLKNNILGLNEELKNIKYQNSRLKSEVVRLRNIKRPQKRFKFTYDKNVMQNVSYTENIETHMKLIKELLFDQDDALKELSKVGMDDIS